MSAWERSLRVSDSRSRSTSIGLFLAKAMSVRDESAPSWTVGIINSVECPYCER